MKKVKITLRSNYGQVAPVTLVAEVNEKYNEHEVSYRQAVKAAANCGGDYYPGLIICRVQKRAWYEGGIN